MTLDGLLTVLALAAAIYAVIQPVPRLRARLALWIQIPVAALAFASVLYLELFETVGRPCPSAIAAACAGLTFMPGGSFRPNQLAFLVVLGWIGGAWMIHKFARPGAGALAPMRRLVDRLVYEHRYAELIDFIEPYVPFVGRVVDRELLLQRISSQFAEWRGEGRITGTWRGLLNQPPEKSKTGWSTWRFLLPWLGRLGGRLPSQRRAEEAAQEILRILHNAAGMRRFIVEMRPYFALSLLRLKSYGRADFFDAYLAALIERPGSILYQELEQNQNLAGGHRYALPDRNRLLYFLFSNANCANDLGAWQAVGDYMLKMLRPGGDAAYLQFLNGPSEGFEEERWHDPVFAGLFYFDIMVTSAAFQHVRYHMWLFYLPKVIARLAESYDDNGPGVDGGDEFPTRGARLIYEAFDALGGWVAVVDELPAGAFHRAVPDDPSQAEGRIPISAAIALGQSMKAVLMAANVSPSFRQYMLEVAMRDLCGLGREGEAGAMRRYLARAIVYGGADRALSPTYVRILEQTFAGLDHVLRSDVPEFAEALSAASRRDVR